MDYLVLTNPFGSGDQSSSPAVDGPVRRYVGADEPGALEVLGEHPQAGPLRVVTIDEIPDDIRDLIDNPDGGR